MSGTHRITVGAPVHPEVLDAMAGAGIADEPEAARLVSALRPALGDLFRTRRPVLLAPASPAGLLEAAVRSGVKDRLLAVVGGRDGERLASIAEACGKEVVRAHVPEGGVLEARHLARFLDGPDVDAVALVHAEGSTGGSAPLAELARVVRDQAGIMLLVDATGSLGAEPVETDAWGLDVVVAGSDGPLGLPGGLGLAVVSERMIATARGVAARGWDLDVVRIDEAARACIPGDSLPYPLLCGLARQLERIAGAGGVAARWRNHAALRSAAERWLEANGRWTPLAREGRRSAAMIALRPEGKDEAPRFPVELRWTGDATDVELVRALDHMAARTELMPTV